MPPYKAGIFGALVAALGIGGLFAHAAPAPGPSTYTVDPATLAMTVGKLKGGDTLVLKAGTYLNFGIGGQFSPAVVIDARAATIKGWRGGALSGLDIRGGTFLMPDPQVKADGRQIWSSAVRLDRIKDVKFTGVTFLGPAAMPDAGPDTYGQGNGLAINGADGVEVTNSTFRGLRNGIAMTSVDNFRLAGNLFEGMRADGITLGMVHKGVIEDNHCRGTRRLEHDHSDCIQLWSRPVAPPTGDIIIRRNRAEGATQGILMANHTRNGVNDGGFERILIEENEINVGFQNGITLGLARDSIVRNNRVSTYPGSQFRATITVYPEVMRCGNVVDVGGFRGKVKDKKC